MNKIRIKSSTIVAIAAALWSQGCDVADETGPREVLRTHRGTPSERTEVLTVEDADGALRTVLTDARGDERAEIVHHEGGVDAGTAAMLDGQDWEPESLGALELPELHAVLHDVGGGLPGASASTDLGSGKADGANPGVVSGYYAATDAQTLIDGCGGDPEPPRELEEGQRYVTPIVEVHDLTESSYTATWWVAMLDGTLRHTNDHPDGNYSKFMECQRVGPVVAFCQGSDVWDIAPGILTLITGFSEIHIWNRTGGGYRVALAQNSTDCEGSICGAIEESSFPNGLPCHTMSKHEGRPTALPVEYEPGDSV